MKSTFKTLVFGASGALGREILSAAISRGDDVSAVSRTRKIIETETRVIESVPWLPREQSEGSLPPELVGKQFHAVVWAQGMNISDDIFSVDMESHFSLYRANVTYILLTLQALLKNQLLVERARLCIVSSIWQMAAREGKLSYCITKAALQGLVNSLAIDLANNGHLVNAILPGPIDTPMTRANLSSEQLAAIQKSTPHKCLVKIEDVCDLVMHLCSTRSGGMTGQFITVDNGFLNAKIS